MRTMFLAAGLTLMLGVTGASAHHKPGHQMPPGQAKKQLPADITIVVPPPDVEFVCLVTTDTPGDPLAPVVSTQWLPRGLAEAEAAKGDSFIIYHPRFDTQDGCLSF